MVEILPAEHKDLGFVPHTENHHHQTSSELQDKAEETQPPFFF